MNAMPVLVRREFWEHRVLWIAPLVLMGVMLIATLFGSVNVDMQGMHLGAAHQGPPEDGAVVFVLRHLTVLMPMALLLTALQFFYLLDCLYGERRDRSILFWKSLPVSDAATVLSKLLTALVVAPLGIYALALVTDLLASGIILVRLDLAASPEAYTLLNSGGVWLHLQALMLGDLGVMALWDAPLAGYLLLVSAWARRHVFVWALFPPLGLIAGEWVAFRTWRIAELLGYRIAGVWDTLGSHAPAGGAGASAVTALFDRLNALPLLARADLWLGLLVGAALVYAAVRIRRYRDDT
jgi:ABC-2 type transport system permease protein